MKLAVAGAGIALLLASVTSSLADVRIQYDPGGHIPTYYAHYEKIRRTGERVVIDGPCMSACTLLLGMLPAGQVCATPKASLGFHEAWYTDGRSRAPSPHATRFLLSHYPRAVRAWIARRGGLTPQMLTMRGNDLRAVVAPCGPASQGV